MLDPSVSRCPDLHEMLSHPDLDVVLVATPNRMHVDHGIQVLEADKWLVVEKPVAETPEQFDALLARRNTLDGRCTVALHAAFGMEVDWFEGERDSGRFDEFRFDTFHAQFYDPYFEDERLQERASALGGSWLDSGINALSVLCRFIKPGNMSVCDSRMTRVAGVACAEVQGTVDFVVSDSFLTGTGSVDTNWTIGRDSKTTTFRDSRSRRELILDHSAQRVRLAGPNGNELLFSCQNDLPRLTNHYVGVFENLAAQMESDTDNIHDCQKLHEFLHQAEFWNS
jgi:predicted dehydrogenase